MTTAFDTVWPSDSVEFCPENPQNIFVCGTYKLDQAAEAAESSDALASVSIGPKTQRRRGTCQVFEVISGIRRELWVMIRS
jgi:diphthamide biosynthesis protein 7